ncbi:MAG: PPK2 family polyphosphate kinase [Capsulimonadaceae bacterium]
MSRNVKVDEQKKIKLSDYDPGYAGKLDRRESDRELVQVHEEFAALQERLYAASQTAVLIVLQGMDTSGKDGTIAHVMQNINPQGCRVASFKVPTPEEAGHDFLWRIHKQTPPKGMITIFNRSHYEDVLITRVHGLIDREACERRYKRIRQFEEHLVDEGTLVMKFFLHISKDEQEARLLAREQDDTKAWKLASADWSERRRWDDYTTAYEDAIGATASRHAPWYIIPSNHKWYRSVTIGRIIVETLRPHRDDWDAYLKKLGEERKAEIAQMRAAGSKTGNGRD